MKIKHHMTIKKQLVSRKANMQRYYNKLKKKNLDKGLIITLMKHKFNCSKATIYNNINILKRVDK